MSLQRTILKSLVIPLARNELGEKYSLSHFALEIFKCTSTSPFPRLTEVLPHLSGPINGVDPAHPIATNSQEPFSRGMETVLS